MKVMELFGGIGSPRKALEEVGIDFEIVDYVEIDKYAVKSYNGMYNENYEIQDVTQWDKEIDVDLIFHGSPCQDFSIAGKQQGGEEASGTRSSLMWHTVRIVEKLKPKYVVWENVKGVLFKKNIDTFNKYLKQMEALGYTNHHQVLNAKDYTIPQNRDRVYVVSILGDQKFEFPKKQELKLTLKDMFENSVDEKYYLSDKMNRYVLDLNKMQKVTKWENSLNDDIKIKDVRNSKQKLCDDLVESGILKGGEIVNHSYTNNRRNKNSRLTHEDYVETRNGILPTLHTRGDVMGVVEFGSYYTWKNNKGEYNTQCNRAANPDKSSLTIAGIGNNKVLEKSENKLRIRKLTPLECWRLMGFDDEDFYKAKNTGMSDAQLYKQAGNSIVVDVLGNIFKELFKKENNE